MNGTIFGIGPLEVLMVVIMVLLVFGPERLPGLMRDLGRNLRRFRKYYVAFAAELKKEMEPFQDDFKEITDTAAELRQDLAAIRDAADIRGIITTADQAPVTAPQADATAATPADVTAAQTIAPPAADNVTPVAVPAPEGALSPLVAAPVTQMPFPMPYVPHNGNGAAIELSDDNPWVQAVRAPRADRLDDDNPWAS
jgi:sec-independent protein translocase protein TatB